MCYGFGVVFKKPLSCPRSPRISPILSSRWFIVLHFTFRNNPLEFIFVKGIKPMSRLISLWMSTCSRHHLCSIRLPCSFLKDQSTILMVNLLEIKLTKVLLRKQWPGHSGVFISQVYPQWASSSLSINSVLVIMDFYLWVSVPIKCDSL